MNHVLILDNYLSEQKCDELIETFVDSAYYQNSENHTGYKINYDVKYNHLGIDKINFALNEYINTYKEIKYTPNQFKLDENELRFKHFEPGNYYETWHCEHSYKFPYRVMNYMIYLSTHDCGTEFWNGDIIKSEKGRLVMFPAAYTHIHRGQKCPDNNNRYLVGGYINYYLGLD